MPRIRIHGSLYYARSKKKMIPTRGRKTRLVLQYCSISYRNIAKRIKMKNLNRSTSLFHALKQTRVHNIVNIYCEHNIASDLCHSRTIPNRDMRFRITCRNDGFFITRTSPRLINTMRSRNATGHGATLSTRVRACEICIEFRPLKSASLISVRTSDAYKNVPRAYDKRLTRSFIRRGAAQRGVRI